VVPLAALLPRARQGRVPASGVSRDDVLDLGQDPVPPVLGDRIPAGEIVIPGLLAVASRVRRRTMRKRVPVA
jgi:hypothetical protein